MSLSTIEKEQKKAIAPKKMLISVETYQEMGKAGIFEGIPRVELINGEIYTMSPSTPNHTSHTKKIAAFFTKILEEKILVGCQDPVQLNDFSEPEPDISILKPAVDFYLSGHPVPEDIFLLIEVAVFTEKHDQTIKKKDYATSNIPEYWIIIPKKAMIEVYRQPKNGKYTEKVVYKKEDSWTFAAFDLEVKGSDFLI